MQRTDVVWQPAAYMAIVAARRAAAPREACGALLGRGALVTAAVELHNVAPGDHDYQIDPEDVARMYALEDAAGGEGLLGWWHTHPASSSEPSSIDVEYAIPGYLYAVCGEDGMTTFRVS